MVGKSLSSSLKSLGAIETDLGAFEYEGSIGQGGNSFVYHFKKSNKDFAIKFLMPSSSSKISRFKDEFFCTVQMQEHQNLVKYLHFDKVEVDDCEYNIIVMKLYKGSLKGEGCIKALEEEDRADKAWKLFCDVAHGLSHLHKNEVYHRDLKPENIFIDEASNYVLGDLGIAHFNEELFPKLSETSSSDRMANWGFSPPEQLNSKSPIGAASDIYSLGQVINWYLTEEIVRGVSRARFSNSSSPDSLRWLDQIVERCLSNSKEDRFQSVDEIWSFVKELNKPKKFDYWPMLHEFDDAICKSFPSINELISTSENALISRFIVNFQESCDVSNFWYMNLEGGDNTCGEIKPIDDNVWLFCDHMEFKLNKLIIYKDHGYPYKNFFIFLIDPLNPFDVVDQNGSILERDIPDDWNSDYATYWNERYIDHNEAKNGYYEFNGEVLAVDSTSFQERKRFLHKYAFIIVPKGTATARMTDRAPTQRLLDSVVEEGDITDRALKAYLEETRGEHSAEITRYN